MNRYPAPHAEGIWSDEGRISRLRAASERYATEALRGGLLGPRDDGWALDAIAALRSAPDPTPEAWRTREATFGHEIVGFLAAYLDQLPKDVHPYVHYGLTSSDLVEYDLHRALALHAQEVTTMVGDLRVILFHRMRRHKDLPRAGRTHGQTAEVTTLGHQFLVFFSTLMRHQTDLQIQVPIKSPGPTGADHGVRGWPEGSVASTQILPRDYLLRWASAMLNLSNTLETMAMFVRLGCRSEIGEFREGAAQDRQGSSAMPGKANPIDSEKVCGLARVARGHFLAIAEVSALWEDRDLSNSSTERIAVPGLASTVEHMLSTVLRVYTHLEVFEDVIRQNADHPRCHTSALQCEIQKTQHVGPIEASRLAKEGIPL